MNSFDNKDVLDFADFDFDHYQNEGCAGRLAAFIMSFVGVDDFVCADTEIDIRFECTAGCGNSPTGFKYPNQGQALSALASHFAGYSVGRYGSCYLAKCDYDLLVGIQTYIEDDYNPSARMQGSGEWLHGLNMLNDVIAKFENAYAKDHPDFLIKVLKRKT